MTKTDYKVPDLPSEGTLGNFVAVLSCYAKFGVKLGPGKVQVDGWSTTHHLCYNSENRDQVRAWKPKQSLKTDTGLHLSNYKSMEY